MCRYRVPGFATQLFLYHFDDVVWHEWFPVVPLDVPGWHETGFAAQIAGELAAVVVLNTNRVPGIFEDVQNCVAVQRHEPADLELMGRNALLGEDLTGVFNSSITPLVEPQPINVTSASRGHHSTAEARGLDAGNLAHALFHQGAALWRVREFVADQDASFIVFVAVCV